MRFNPHNCPVCGEAANAILENVPAWCGIAPVEEGDDAFDYDGSGDTMLWDGQTMEVNERRVQLKCPNGHNWIAELTDGERSS